MHPLKYLKQISTQNTFSLCLPSFSFSLILYNAVVIIVYNRIVSCVTPRDMKKY